MPYLMTPQFVADVYRRYGADSPLDRARCLGRFPASAADTLILLAWVLAAVARWKERTELKRQRAPTG